MLHLVLFAGLALVSMGGSEPLRSVDITSDFERTETPTPVIEETTPPPEKEKPTYEDVDDVPEDEFDDPIEEEDEIVGDPESPTDQPLSEDTIGMIGTAGGLWNGAYSQRQGHGRGGDGGGTDATPLSENAVNKGLKWLADHQEPDGHWDTKKWGGHGPYDPGICGLALLAFAGAGQTEKTGKYRRTVQKAIKWLAENQDTDGNFAPGQTMYSHAIPTLALLESAAMAPIARTRSIAKRGLDYMLNAQNQYKAWRYWPNDGDNDMSVTTWCVMAMKAANVAGFDVSNDAWGGVKAFLEEVTEPNYGQVGYTARPVRGANEQPFQKYSMTACGLLCRLYLGESRDTRLMRLGKQILMENLPEWDQPGINAPFFYYWYYGSLVMFQFEGKEWKRWNEKMHDLLIQHQISEQGELEGSWDPPSEHHFGKMGGRVYSTAMGVLTLEVYYRYEIISGK
ncbi:MAG: prenyltransferase/squalene oxidase repeat-containing protein [Planctomycetota bacterium]|nr:prenyltransferase/squalene oxidase repeat-containing protein [Planctomycetota bacterium]